MNINMHLKTIKIRRQQEDRACFLGRMVRYIQFKQQQKKVKIITMTLDHSHSLRNSQESITLLWLSTTMMRTTKKACLWAYRQEHFPSFRSRWAESGQPKCTNLFKEHWTGTSAAFITPLPMCKEVGGLNLLCESPNNDHRELSHWEKEASD